MQDWKMHDRKMQDKTFSIFAVKLCVLYSYLLNVFTSLYISIASEALMLWTSRLAHLSVCVCVCMSVRKVYCGKMAERIQIPFEVVSEVDERWVN